MKEWKGKPKYEYPKIKELPITQIPLPSIVEPKFDGELNFLFFDTEKKEWVTCNNWGHYRSDYPITEEASVLEKSLVYVGELYSGENLYDFLRRKCNPSNLEMVIFDVLTENPSSRKDCYLTRIEKIPLDTWDSSINHLSKISYTVANSREELEVYFNILSKIASFEGIVCRSINTEEIHKVKKQRTIDVIVLGISKEGKSYQVGEVGSLLVGLMQKGELKKVGKVGSGFQPSERKALWDTLIKAKIGEDDKYIYVRPRIVVEITLNDFIESKEYDFPLTFRCPRFVRFRLDKRPEECEAEHQAPELGV